MPVDSIYNELSETYKVMVWAFDNRIESLIHSQKSKIYTDFISTEIKKITDNHKTYLYYDDNNKPHIKDDSFKSISISHTKNFLSIQLHKEKIAGIDIEMPRETLLKVQKKILNEDEIQLANNHLDTLCMLWTTKESVFKIYGKLNISLKQNIHIKAINNQYIVAQLSYNNKTEEFTLFSKQLIYGMRITYVVKKN